MKHSIRQRVLDPVTGLKVTKIETVNGELGSGIVDCNDKEIFEGDKVEIYFIKDEPQKHIVAFIDGNFKLVSTDVFLDEIAQLDIEVIGHVDD